MTDIKIKKGTRFTHRTVTCYDSFGSTNRCIVTAVRRGTVYFRFENQNRSSQCCQIENFTRYAENIQCPQ